MRSQKWQRFKEVTERETLCSQAQSELGSLTAGLNNLKSYFLAYLELKVTP